jgi:hypothetical protein
VGLFNDLEDNNPDQVPGSSLFESVVGVKPKDYEKAFTGKAPSVVIAPELWRDSRDNLMTAFLLQQAEISQLFSAYKVN